MAAPALLSLKSLSERFDTPVSTLRYYVRTGKLNAVRVGGRVMIPEEEAAAFLRPVKPSVEIGAAVEAIVDAAPALTDAQRGQLAAILGVAS